MKVATVVLILNGMLGLAIAATPVTGTAIGTAIGTVIGTVMSGGAFRLNGDTVQGNGTLTEGAVLESGRGSSTVRLAGGARLSLSADSRGRLYSDRMILEKGDTRLDNGSGFHLEALGLTIFPDRGPATGRIGLMGTTRVRVAAQTGGFRVLNARGVLVAKVAAGSTLAFEPRASPAVTHITGTLTGQSGHFLLTDQVTRVMVEVTGQRLAAYVGHVVGVTGALVEATPVAGASQVIAASEVRAFGAGTGAAPIAIVGGVTARAAVRPITPPGRPPGRPPGGPPPTPPGRPGGRPIGNPPGLSR